MKYLQFSAAWCGPCKMLTPIMEQVKAKGIPVEKIDVYANPDMSAKFGIRSVPTVILVDNNGNEIKRSNGVQTADFYISNFK
jgi:thiol-disulfide isomerase/thioredoxin